MKYAVERRLRSDQVVRVRDKDDLWNTAMATGVEAWIVRKVTRCPLCVGAKTKRNGTSSERQARAMHNGTNAVDPFNFKDEFFRG